MNIFTEAAQINMINYTVDVIMPKLWSIAKILIFIIILRLICYGIIDRVLTSVSNRSDDDDTAKVGRMKTLGSLIKSVLFYILVFIAGVMLLRVFDIDPAPVLTAAGVVGLAVGFGAQKLVRDIIAGFFILLENQYSVGDYITTGAVTGTVVELGMRVTKLKDDIGKLVYISNGDIMQVVNHSRGTVQMILDVNFAPDTDIQKAKEIIDTIGADILNETNDVDTAPIVNQIVGISAASITLRITAEVKSGSQESVQSAIREKIHHKVKDGTIKLA